MRGLFRLSLSLVLFGAVVWAIFAGLSFGYVMVAQTPDPLSQAQSAQAQSAQAQSAQAQAAEAQLEQAQAIVVISGPGALDDLPIGDTATRMETGIALWHAGRAPILVVSGSGANPEIGSVPDSQGMRRFALQRGVADSAIWEEDRSYSTLQNALFTADLPEIDPSEPIILVTSPYHMARSIVSFRWGGFEHVIPVVAAPAERPIYYTVMEGIKGPFNLLRASAATLAYALGIAKEHVDPWLE